MFNNLIESTSHANEFKRRGSFLLFTTATYVALFVLTGVMSIYAYDAHLESQNTELELLTILPLFPEAAAPREIPNTIRPTPDTSGHQPTQSIRTVLIDSANNPNNPSDKIGTVASPVPPARTDSIVGSDNVDPPGPAPGSRTGFVAGTGNKLIEMDTPPPPPAPNPTSVVPKLVRVWRVLNSEALYLPKPIYSRIAKQTGVQGIVTVQVLIDETGRVLTAKAAGHPLLAAEAQKAALQARFSPTLINDQPVKVSGVITYNFVMH